MTQTPNTFLRNMLLALLAVLIFAVGWFTRGEMPTGGFVPVDPPLRAKGDYKYINPLLACGTWESKDFDEYTVLKKKVERAVDVATHAGNAKTVGVYFRELRRGRWFGVNETALFSPASFLKVPVMIAYFKLAERQPDVLNKKFLYDGSFDLNDGEYFRSPQVISKGSVYKGDDLLTAMVVDSDNNATTLLFNAMDRASVEEVFTDLGLPLPDDANAGAPFISPKALSYFLRVLYNATYLREGLSEQALNLLARVQFPQGIQAGVPERVVVANKFGERSVFDASGTLEWRELHDCGIVYAPARPYVLCVMTRGDDFRQLSSVIRDVSKITYEEVMKE